MAAPKKTASKTTKAPASKPVAKKAPASKAPAKKASAKKAPASRAPAKKGAAKKVLTTGAVAKPKKGAKKAGHVEAPAAPKKLTLKMGSAKTMAAKKIAAKKKASAKKIDMHDTGATVPERLSPAVVEAAKSREEVRRDASRELAKLVAMAGLDKKAERIEIIDVCDKADYTDFLVLMSGRSDRQVQAIAQGIEGAVEERGERAQHVEGLRQGQWVIVDFGDVLVHVFLEEERRHRDLESLWMDARRVPLELDPSKTRA